jgi:hypothetical protein
MWAALPETPARLLAAALRRLPAAAVFSGRTAAWLHGLDVACNPIEATVPKECGVSARAGIALRRASLTSRDVVMRRGLRTTSILRTLADLALQLPLADAVAIADEALHQGLVGLPQLDRYAQDRSGSKGVARLRRVVALAEPAAESPMETRLRLLIVLAGLPQPEAQVSLHDAAGRFIGRVDLLYRAARIAIEYDGGLHRDTLVADNRRQNRLLDAGYRLLRFTAADVLGNPGSVVALVRAALD